MLAQRRIVIQLNSLIRDERLYPNRRLLAILLVAFLQNDGEDKKLVRDLIQAQFISGGKITPADREDIAVVEPHTILEAEATQTLKDAINQIPEFGGTNAGDV